MQSQPLSVFVLISRVLIKLTVLGAFFFPLNGALQAANDPRQLDIRVQVNGLERLVPKI